MALFLCGCSPLVELYVPVWPTAEPAVAVFTNASGQILPPSPLLLTPPVRERIVVEAPGLAVHVQTFEALANRDLTGCRAAVNGGEALGPPVESWSSGFIDGPGEISFELDDPPRLFDLHLDDCAVPPRSCDVIAHPVEAPPAVQGLSGVAAISEREAIAIGASRSDDDLRTLLLRGFGDVATELGPFDALRGRGGNLENDGEGLVGAVEDLVFRLDYRGGLVSSSSVGFSVAHLDTGEDGTTIFAGQGGELRSMVRGSSELRTLAPPSYASSGRAPRVAVVRADLFDLFGIDGRIYEWDGGWHELMEQPIGAIAADEETIIIFPDEGGALEFDRDAREWRPLGQIVQMQLANAAAPLGDGRYVFVGQNGLVGYFNGERLCTVDAGSVNHLEDVDFVPALAPPRAWIVGGHHVALGEPTVLRLDLP